MAGPLPCRLPFGCERLNCAAGPIAQWSHSSVGQSVRLITERSAVQARVGPFAAHLVQRVGQAAEGWPAGAPQRWERRRWRLSPHALQHAGPPWPNGQGVGLLIRRLRARVPQGVLLGLGPKMRRRSTWGRIRASAWRPADAFPSLAAIAQLGERQTEDLKVPGSIPGLGTLQRRGGLCARGARPSTRHPLGVAQFRRVRLRRAAFKRTRGGNMQGAHGVVASHPLRMRKALGSNPSVSIWRAY